MLKMLDQWFRKSINYRNKSSHKFLNLFGLKKTIKRWISLNFMEIFFTSTRWNTFTMSAGWRSVVGQTYSFCCTVSIVDNTRTVVYWAVICNSCHSIHFMTAEKRGLHSRLSDAIHVHTFDLFPEIFFLVNLI